jgi:hypothetical protein
MRRNYHENHGIVKEMISNLDMLKYDPIEELANIQNMKAEI